MERNLEFAVNLQHYKELGSTNTEAKILAEQGVAEGTIVIADKQTAGRGRMKRIWESPQGQGLWFTMVLRPTVEAENCAQVTLLTAVAVAKSLQKLTGKQDFKIKWPNDILYRGKKISGILSEMSLDTEGKIDYVIVGIGINVNMHFANYSDQLSSIATSLHLITGSEYERENVLESFLKEFMKLYKCWHNEGFTKIRQAWLENNCTLGREVVVKDEDQEIFAGIAESLYDDGSLCIKNATGVVERFDFGELSVRTV